MHQIQHNRLQEEYTTLVYKNIKYVNDDKDGWFLSNNNTIVRIKIFQKINNDVVILGNEIELEASSSDVYEKPLRSSKLDIFQINNIQPVEKCFQLTDIKEKLLYFTTENDDRKHFFMVL